MTARALKSLSSPGVEASAAALGALENEYLAGLGYAALHPRAMLERELSHRAVPGETTRRKIPNGAMIQALVDTDKIDHTDLEAWLDAHLTRDDDRALFGLSNKT